jgi:hypothetical protein
LTSFERYADARREGIERLLIAFVHAQATMPTTRVIEPQLTGQFQTVHPWQVQINNHRVWFLVGWGGIHPRQRLLAGRCLSDNHNVLIGGERRTHSLAEERVVVDDQQFYGRVDGHDGVSFP